MVARVPGLSKSGSAQIPIGAGLAPQGAQVVPEIGHRWPAPEPIPAANELTLSDFVTYWLEGEAGNLWKYPNSRGQFTDSQPKIEKAASSGLF